jgi:hypothetical protein
LSVQTGFGLVMEFIGRLQVATASNYSAVTDSHAPHFTTHALSFLIMLGNIFQQWMFLCSCAHILPGWWLPTPCWLVSISQDLLHNDLQWQRGGDLHLHPSHASIRGDYVRWVCLPTANCNLWLSLDFSLNSQLTGLSKSKSSYNWRSVSQSGLVSGHIWDLWPISLRLSVDSYGLVIMGTLSHERMDL